MRNQIESKFYELAILFVHRLVSGIRQRTLLKGTRLFQQNVQAENEMYEYRSFTFVSLCSIFWLNQCLAIVILA